MALDEYAREADYCDDSNCWARFAKVLALFT
jgi:hypothetical protein